jgi:hypothetical protein
MSSLSQPFENVFLSVVSNGPSFIGELFRQKFGSPAPGYGHHVIAFYKKSPLCFVPFCYFNFLPHDEIMLTGGAMTNGAAFAEMPRELAAEIREAGGIYYHVIRFGFHHFADDCEAFFGYAGDPRAMEVDLAAGYEPTQHRYLIAHWHKPLSDERKAYLVEKAHQVGPF